MTIHIRSLLSRRAHRLCDSLSGTSSKPSEFVATRASNGDVAPEATNLTLGFPYFEQLPLELQLEILGHYLAVYPSLAPGQGPLLLCQVSRTWRCLVFTTPKLWARFQVDIPGQRLECTAQTEQRMDNLARWLTLSKNYPLSFRIAHDAKSNLEDDRSAQVLSVLIPHAHRWKNVTLSIPSWSVGLLQAALPETLPVLQSVTIDMKGFRSTAFPLDIVNLRLPWSQLRSLHLHLDTSSLLTLDDCMVILSQCVNLAGCTLEAMPSFAPRRMLDRLPLPRLSQFGLTLRSGDYLTTSIREPPESCLLSFLEQLEAVQLQDLRLDWLLEPTPHWSDVHPRFVSVLSGLALSLNSLTLSYLPITEAQLSSTVPRLVNLAHLHLRFSLTDIEHDPITDHFLNACAWKSKASSAEVLPCLETVQLQCSGAHCTSLQVAEFIRSRRAPDTAQLRSFRMVSMNPSLDDLNYMLPAWTTKELFVSVEQIIVR